MKDTLIKTLTLLLGFGLVTYVVWLMTNNAQVIAEPGGTNTLILICCAGVALYLVAINFFPSWIPHNRWALAVAGFMMLVIADALLVDNPANQVYLADIMKLIGVFFIIAGPTKLLITKKAQEKKESGDVEIIEV